MRRLRGYGVALVAAGAAALALQTCGRPQGRDCELSASDRAELCSDLGDAVADEIERQDGCRMPAGWRESCTP